MTSRVPQYRRTGGGSPTSRTNRLPELFAVDFDRVARFKREAQVLASLNHPHIAAIYGFEETNGVQALALELVDGPTLADRIAQGPIPLDEALPTARQIAAALEAAHQHGIIHRDLKPANIKLRPDGAVKVLDFGLAKVVQPTAGPSSAATTFTAATREGLVLGTPAYMSPEQAGGQPADERTDIWAFGCVLYEMLSGKRLFDGKTAADSVARVLTHEPEQPGSGVLRKPSAQNGSAEWGSAGLCLPSPALGRGGGRRWVVEPRRRNCFLAAAMIRYGK